MRYTKIHTVITNNRTMIKIRTILNKIIMSMSSASQTEVSLSNTYINKRCDKQETFTRQ